VNLFFDISVFRELERALRLNRFFIYDFAWLSI